MREPTLEECSDGAIIEADGRKYFATWYPQIGGYVARCLVELRPGRSNKCFDAYIWHDGEFPFSGHPPVMLHHCDLDQFVDFAERVRKAFGDKTPNDDPKELLRRIGEAFLEADAAKSNWQHNRGGSFSSRWHDVTGAMGKLKILLEHVAFKFARNSGGPNG